MKVNKGDRIPRKIWIFLVVGLLATGLAGAFVYGLINEPSAEPAPITLQKKEAPDFQKLIGRWVRTDGGYVIELSKIHPDGRAEATYLNPRPINVSRSTVSEVDGVIILFIELRDQGYPGSTYELKYHPDHDMMVGVYFQAAIQQSYDVVFQRK
ncbi:MAG: hypothetical protein HF978_14820 [Desulfobacteraceae bacterium]|nr:hypothetical protein [Desulfobacteraceae bacterium]MBC2756812.1 hypothetical protein [Desulfobacteraceae bacterium]